MKTENIDLNPNTYKKNTLTEEESLIDVKISEVVLTPLTCASLINEILKGVLYQKCQIPYPYSWLKSVVDKKRQESNVEKPNKPINFTAANHFRVVSSAYDTIENVMNGIIREFKENGNTIKEVVFVFGTTPHCPKEVFTINISSVANGHFEQNHVHHISKHQQKILRNIFLSQNWMDTVDATSTCTNIYIFLKKHVSDENLNNSENSNKFFIPSKPLSFPTRSKHVKIRLSYRHSDNSNCCNNLSVFEDVSESRSESVNRPLKEKQLECHGNSESVNRPLRERQLECRENSESESSLKWYQSRDLLKGFKDCYVNKVSACELW